MPRSTQTQSTDETETPTETDQSAVDQAGDQAGDQPTVPSETDETDVEQSGEPEAGEPEAGEPDLDMSELVMAYSPATKKASPMSRLMAQMSGCEVLDEVSTRNPDGSMRDVTTREGRPIKPRTSVDEAAGRVQSPDADQASAVAATASADPKE